MSKDSPHLISHHLCPYVQRAVIVLTEKNIEHNRTYIDLDNTPDWFAKASPLGRVPLLEIEGAMVFESQVIAEYLDEATPGSLHPVDLLEKARHRSWIEFGSETLAAIGDFYNVKDKSTFDQKAQVLRTKFERVNEEVIGSFFSGEEFHMIDGVWGTIFRYFDVFDQLGEFGVLKGLDKVSRWRTAVSERPSVVAAPPEGYNDRLHVFLKNRPSYLGQLIN